MALLCLDDLFYIRIIFEFPFCRKGYRLFMSFLKFLKPKIAANAIKVGIERRREGEIARFDFFEKDDDGFLKNIFGIVFRAVIFENKAGNSGQESVVDFSNDLFIPFFYRLKVSLI